MFVARLFFAFLLFGLCPHLVGQESPAPALKMQVECDTRVELMSILMRLSGASEYNMANARSPYSDEVDAWFKPFRKHAAVQTLQRMRRDYGVSYDAPISLAVHLQRLGKVGELLPFEQQPQRLDTRWPLQETRVFLKELQDFVDQSSFHKFVAAHDEFYQLTAERMRTKLLERSYLPWLTEFFGNPPGARFQVIPGLLNGGANYGMGVVFADGSEFITPIIGVYSWDEQGLPLFDDSFVPTVMHEFVHSFTNPLVNVHWPALQPSMAQVFSHCKGLMTLQAYSTPRIVMMESLVRASVRCYLLTSGDSAAANTHLRQQIQAGFVWTEELADLLMQYQQQREQFPTFASFMPEVVTLWQSIAKEYVRTMAHAPRVVAISPDPNKPLPPDTRELVITFSCAMQVGSYAITNQGPAPQFGKASFDATATVLTIPMVVQPGAHYSLSLNNLRFRGFKSKQGVALDPYPLLLQVATH